MRWKLATKISIAIVGVVVLALLSGSVALLAVWRIGQLMQGVIQENLPGVRAAEELEIALLEQRGIVSAYLLDDGNPSRLSERERLQTAFRRWLAEARATSRTAEEQEILARLVDVYQRYDARRDEVIELFDRGDFESARAMLFVQVNDLYQRAYGLCEEFIAANERSVERVTAQSSAERRRVTWLVCGCVLLTLAFGSVLLWLFFQGVMRPLRVMMADTRMLASQFSLDAPLPPDDELRDMGLHLRRLMLDMADTRSTLARSRAQLLDAEKLASVGKLAACVAHEIRNPLTATKMWLFSAKESLPPGAASGPMLAKAFDQIHHLEIVVRNFLEFSRPPELRRSDVTVSQLIDQALELARPTLAEQDIRVDRPVLSSSPVVSVDREQLVQVLTNVLYNAAQAMRQGGLLRIEERQEEVVGRSMAVVRIQDDGPGIPTDLRDRIFDPFFSTKDQGTGLGLCISASIMSRHEGRLTLETSSERGSTFALWIPYLGANRHAPNPGH